MGGKSRQAGAAYFESKAIAILEREFRAYCAENSAASAEAFAALCTNGGARNHLGFSRDEIAARLVVGPAPANAAAPVGQPSAA
jgi:hypothetical protein